MKDSEVRTVEKSRKKKKERPLVLLGQMCTSGKFQQADNDYF